MSEFDTLDVSRVGHWLYATLNRPKRRNAMNRKMVDELVAVAESVRSDASIRALVLRGAGGHCFIRDYEAMRRYLDELGGDPLALEALSAYQR